MGCRFDPDSGHKRDFVCKKNNLVKTDGKVADVHHTDQIIHNLAGVTLAFKIYLLKNLQHNSTIDLVSLQSVN